jgi:hypothetical protein
MIAEMTTKGTLIEDGHRLRAATTPHIHMIIAFIENQYLATYS